MNYVVISKKVQLFFFALLLIGIFALPFFAVKKVTKPEVSSIKTECVIVTATPVMTPTVTIPVVSLSPVATASPKLIKK